MRWFIGLGNPGSHYALTRHNFGFMAVDRFAEKHGITFVQSKWKALIGEGVVEGEKVVLIKPLTYMNLSGEAARAYMDFHKADLADMLVLYDDLDTPYGQIRLRYQGGPGGHNGIKSLIQHLGTQQFNRIRIGISRPQPAHEVADYVLSLFSKEERDRLPDILDRAVEAMELCLVHPFEKAMARCNAVK